MTMQPNQICYCKKDIMSICSAPGLKHQRDCRFYVKSTYNSRCMFYRFDAFCDSLDAQVNVAREEVIPAITAIQT